MSINYASGIKYNGSIDNTESTNNPNAMNGAVFIGMFKRGRSDKPMLIDSSNIRAKLGYDPTNPDYIAVQSAIDNGKRPVRVLRIANPSQACCDKAITMACDCSATTKQVNIDCDC